jgi:anthranilate phosphoribosyltransferase
MICEGIQKLIEQTSLSFEESTQMMREIMTGKLQMLKQQHSSPL